MPGYNFTAIEKKWQQYWADNNTFFQPNPGQEGFDGSKPKMFILDMFPYPSGAGLHVGHPEGYTATDILARYKRMTGFNVLHPMGYDSFGLPAEQYAVEHGVHPRDTTQKNIDNIERQIKMFGFSYDWSRRIATTDVEFYRWTQWIFLKLYNSFYDEESNRAEPISLLIHRLESGEYVVDATGKAVVDMNHDINVISGEQPCSMKWHEMSEEYRKEVIDNHRLAYMAEVPVNWCPKLGTVLANEEVTNEGKSERGNHPVYRRALKQWMLRITAYAERLLNDIDHVDWPEPIKIMQRNWIGKSVGAEVDFPIANHTDSKQWFEDRKDMGFPGIEEENVLRVYTTRPDTLFGVSYMVIAPEHPLIDVITTDEQKQAVADYVQQAVNKSDMDRQADTKEKTGVFTGAYAINPLNGQQVPIWTADYVMMGYGTGAIMAVPCHDSRDYDFAKKFDLPIKPILKFSNESDAWYYADLTDEQLQQCWSKIIASPDDFPTLRGVHSGTREMLSSPGLALNITSKVKKSVEKYFNQKPDLTRRLYFVGAERLKELLPADAKIYPMCTTSLDDSMEYISSNQLDGLQPKQGKKQIVVDIENEGFGQTATQYKLRDWLFSRQRYWGEPFPIVHCDTCGTVSLEEANLPLELPEMDDFSPASSDDPLAPPQPPLGKVTDWVNTTCPCCKGPATRELNTMPQWAGSCWYFLRYLDPKNESNFIDPEIEKYWMGTNPDNPAGGVDLYVGGAEHAVLHLLYARFWHKVLFDLGCVSTVEPFYKLYNQGMIRSFAYRDSRNVCIGYDDIDFREDGAYHKDSGEKLIESVEKMSKSLKNVVNPDEIINEFGADTFRLYEMFMGPLDQSKPWNTRDVPGVFRFLQRVWRMIAGDEENNILPIVSDKPANEELEKQLHKLIKKIGQDIEAMKFNTAIAAMMEFTNSAFKTGHVSQDQAERLVLLLAPLAPHICEELWQILGHNKSLAYQPFPQFDPEMLIEKSIEIPVQINGKVKGRITISPEDSQEAVMEIINQNAQIASLIEGKNIVKTIYIPGRMVNMVVK